MSFTFVAIVSTLEVMRNIKGPKRENRIAYLRIRSLAFFLVRWTKKDKFNLQSCIYAKIWYKQKLGFFGILKYNI